MSTLQEMLYLGLFFGGFLLSFAKISKLIEKRWPSQKQVQFGNFGLIPSKTGLFFFIWIPIYTFVVVKFSVVLGF
jgi:hypothetical protein